MAKDKRKRSSMGEFEDILDTVVVKDKNGNLVHQGSYIPQEPAPTEEEQLELAEATAWFEAMLDPNGFSEILDVGIATGEDYAEPTQEA